MKKYLTLVIILSLALLISGCKSNPEITRESGEQNLNSTNPKCHVGLFLSSSGKKTTLPDGNKVKPETAVVTSAVVKFDSFEIHRYGDAEAGWHTIDAPGSSIDLLAMANLEELFLTEIQDGSYNKLRLKIVEAEITLESGEIFQAVCPSNKIDFNFSFTIANGELAEITCEIDPEKSIVKANKNKFKISPVMHLIGVVVN